MVIINLMYLVIFIITVIIVVVVAFIITIIFIINYHPPHPHPASQGLLERLQDGVVIGDGGFVIALEKRGYVKGGPWTPEVVVEHPDAGEKA